MINEILMYGGPELKGAVYRFFQEIWDLEVFPEDWSKGLIFPIFKGGTVEAKQDPMNYRGITLLSVVGKLYTIVLKNRLEEWCESKGILAEEQAGFRKARSTIDHIFTLHEMIMCRRPLKTYCCFIDVQKAYDRVWRQGLWKKLYDYGVRGKLWRILKNIYAKVESCVLVNEERTEFFQILLGLRQGCILSPLLFDLFINDLVEEIRRSGLGVQVGNDKIGILLFADDIVLTAESEEDLQILMDITYQYSRKWRFTFNLNKSAVVIFQHRNARKAECKDEEKESSTHWRLGDARVAEVDMYKYLGMEFDKGLTFLEFKRRMADKARKNRALAMNMGLKRARLSVKAGINLWNSMVRPSLEYGAQVWGLGKWDPAELVQREMGRKILGCPAKSPNAGIRGELGWWLMQTRRDFMKIKWWIQLIQMHPGRLSKKIYGNCRQIFLRTRRNNFTKGIFKLAIKYDLLDIWNDEAKVNRVDPVYNTPKKVLDYWIWVIRHKMLKVEEKAWKQERAKKPKLCRYERIKHNLELEKYLHLEVNARTRRHLTALRIGAFPLRIEVGRWKREPVEERICLQCVSGQLENESHFLAECEAYQRPREILFTRIREISNNLWKPERYSKERNWELIMDGTNIRFCRATMDFVTAALEIRNRL